MDYRFTNYYVQYKAVVTKGNSLILNYKSPNHGAACFSELFCALENKQYDQTFNLKLQLICNKKEMPHKNNFIILNEEEIKWWLRVLHQIVSFHCKYKINEDTVKFNINTTNTKFNIKFLCTALRIFFEYPFNEVAKDVYDLKNTVKRYEKINFTKYSAFYLLLIGLRLARTRALHSFIKEDFVITKIQELKQKINAYKDFELNEFFKYDKAKRMIRNYFENFNYNSELCRKTFEQRIIQYKDACKKKSILH